jgi:SagB-type dehydrogenase family enzyme
VNRNRTEITGIVRDAVGSVLGVADPDPEANLIGLGANSMELIRIVNRLEDALSIRLQFEDLTDAPSIAGLTDALQRRFASPQAAQVPAQAASPLKDRRELLAYPLEAVPHAAAVARSTRRFSTRSVTKQQLERLLCSLKIEKIEGKMRAAYGSAGALFPIQVYLYLRSGRVEGIAPGLFYYHPTAHQLNLLASEPAIESGLYEPILNGPIFERAAFAIYFVSRPSAIEPVYGDRSRDFCLIESGSMAQLLRDAAGALGLGLCPIGEFKFAPVRRWFGVDADQECLYSFLGGALPQQRDSDFEVLLQQLRVR